MASGPIGVENEMDTFTCRQSIHGLTGLRRLEASTAGLASIIKKGGQKSDLGPLVCFRRRQTNAGGLAQELRNAGDTFHLRLSKILHVHFKTSRFGVLVSLEHLGASSKKLLLPNSPLVVVEIGRGRKGCTITALHAWPNALCTSEGKTKTTVCGGARTSKSRPLRFPRSGAAGGGTLTIHGGFYIKLSDTLVLIQYWRLHTPRQKFQIRTQSPEKGQSPPLLRPAGAACIRNKIA
ncbi:hypothetical protein EDB89DRAFT_1907391 [Lactarius sanguifluus]|nr:hypothetical protein EDB89DRAFT_1907391 [Lactarius sanguifluus]